MDAAQSTFESANGEEALPGEVSDRNEPGSDQNVDRPAQSGAGPAGPVSELKVREPIGVLAKSVSQVPTERLPNNDAEQTPLGVGQARHDLVKQEVGKRRRSIYWPEIAICRRHRLGCHSRVQWQKSKARPVVWRP